MSENVVLAVCFQLKQLKKQPGKNSGLNGIRTHDLAIPVQCSIRCNALAQWIEHCAGIARSLSLRSTVLQSVLFYYGTYTCTLEQDNYFSLQLELAKLKCQLIENNPRTPPLRQSRSLQALLTAVNVF